MRSHDVSLQVLQFDLLWSIHGNQQDIAGAHDAPPKGRSTTKSLMR
jgi:hypothetical protein